MDTKKWYLSKGIWTGVASTLLGLYYLLKVNLFPSWPEIPEILISVLGILGVTFRARATTTITK